MKSEIEDEIEEADPTGLALTRAITRGPPTILRLTAIYAVLDETLTISPSHLRAAREVWRYSVDSARVIFGDEIGHPDARKILEPLRSGVHLASEDRRSHPSLHVAPRNECCVLDWGGVGPASGGGSLSTGKTASEGTALPALVHEPRSVVEIGAHSLKFHQLRRGRIHTVKYAYTLGHEVYTQGEILQSTVHRVEDLIAPNIIPPTIAIGTSAVRDARNRDAFVKGLYDGLNLPVHILSSWEEAMLLTQGYLAHSTRLPAMVADIGGGTVEIVFLGRTKTVLWDSLPLGAIRLYHRGFTRGRSDQLAWIESTFRQASIARVGHVYATGGTVAALSRTLHRRSFTTEEIQELELTVRRKGPPPRLKAARARVFHAGLLLVRKLLDFVGADKLTYVDISIGRAFLSRFGGSPDIGRPVARELLAIEPIDTAPPSSGSDAREPWAHPSGSGR